MSKLYMNLVWSLWGHSVVDSSLKNDQISYESSLELLRPSFIWFLIENNQILCESSLELLKPFCNWFLIEKSVNSIRICLELLRAFLHWFLIEESLNFIWIQPGALDVILYSILNWKMSKFHMKAAWSSWGHSLLDS